MNEDLEECKNLLERLVTAIEKETRGGEPVKHSADVIFRINDAKAFLKISKENDTNRYFLIIGRNINFPMGCCNIKDVKNVHAEEPDAKFYEISEKEYCNYDENVYDKHKNWLSESKFYDQLID